MIYPLQCSQLSVHGVEVELLWVELPADPPQHIVMALVLRVSNRFEEVGIDPRTAAVLRWTRSRPFDAAGILDLGLWLQRFLQGDLVLPGVAEVVLVGEPDLP